MDKIRLKLSGFKQTSFEDMSAHKAEYDQIKSSKGWQGEFAYNPRLIRAMFNYVVEDLETEQEVADVISEWAAICQDHGLVKLSTNTDYYEG